MTTAARVHDTATMLNGAGLPATTAGALAVSTPAVPAALVFDDAKVDLIKRTIC